MSMFPAVQGYRNGTEYPLHADVLNVPVTQLKERTDYLKERVDALMATNAFDSVRMHDVPLAVDTPKVLMPVYFDTNTQVYTKAIADVETSETYPYRTAAQRSHVVGLVVSTLGARGTIVLNGVVDTSTVDWSSVLQSGEEFRPGSYYLSSVEPGKITATAGAIAVYLGEFSKTKTVFRAEVKDSYQAHLHKSFVLTGKGSGNLVGTSLGGFASTEGAVTLHFGGTYLGTDTTYTFEVTCGSSLATLAIKWKTLDGSDNGWDSPVVLGGYHNEVSIGTKGLTVFATAAALDAVPATQHWMLSMPRDIQGWRTRLFNKTAVQTVGTKIGPSIVAFGSFSAQTTKFNTYTLVAAPGTVNKPMSTTTFNVSHNGVAIGTIVGLAFNKPKALTTGAKAMLINPTGVAAPSVNEGDTWTVTITDEVPGSAYQYMVNLDPTVAPYFPPNPLVDVVLEYNGTVLQKIGEYVPGKGHYEVTPNGVFLTTDFPGQVYPTGWTKQGDAIELATAHRFKLYTSYMRMGAAGIVTGIKSVEGSHIALVDAKTGEPASTGDLLLKASLGVTLSDSVVEGYQAIKGVDTKGRFLRGPVVEKLVAGPGVTINQSAGNPAGQGTVTISSQVDGLNRGEFSDVSLLNAKSELLPGGKMISYIKLLSWNSASANNIKSAFVCKFRVPQSLDGKYRVELSATVFGDKNTTEDMYAGLKATYNIVQDYGVGANPSYVRKNLLSDAITGVVKHDNGTPYTDIQFTDSSGTGAYAGYDPMLIHTGTTPIVHGQVFKFGDAFPYTGDAVTSVTAGDIIAVKFERVGPSNSGVAGTGHQAAAKQYTGAIGFLSINWKLNKVD